MIKWSTGIDGYKKHTLENVHFTTTLTENEFEPNRNIDAIFSDHLVGKPNSPVELLYSGGLDSEVVLMSLLRSNIPVEAMTMVITIKGAILNVVDLYYSEKFCREHNVKQNLFYFDAVEFYESGKYLEYVLPLSISEPHISSHLWLIEQCHNFPIIGGDWPWVQPDNRVLSPFKLAFSSYERFMESKGISGIGNMISHSFESSYHFIEKHIEAHKEDNTSFHTVPFLKYKMYGLTEPRIKSYGWEESPIKLFNINKYKVELLKHLADLPKAEIIWGDQISKLIKSTVNSNTKFS